MYLVRCENKTVPSAFKKLLPTTTQALLRLRVHKSGLAPEVSRRLLFAFCNWCFSMLCSPQIDHCIDFHEKRIFLLIFIDFHEILLISMKNAIFFRRKLAPACKCMQMLFQVSECQCTRSFVKKRPIWPNTEDCEWFIKMGRWSRIFSDCLFVCCRRETRAARVVWSPGLPDGLFSDQKSQFR
jgi:hypothetical protein